MNKYKIASQLLNNIQVTSDTLNFTDCYFLCACKDNINKLDQKQPQIIWGRRGTGKTTLLKAFNYYINCQKAEQSTISVYINISKLIPNYLEIESISDDGECLALYIFTNFLIEVCKSLVTVYDEKKDNYNKTIANQFTECSLQLYDYLEVCKKNLQEKNTENKVTQETETEKSKEIEIGGGIKFNFFRFVARALRKDRTKSKTRIEKTGHISFNLETQKVCTLLDEMLNCLAIDLAYICIDEYSEIDKVCKYSIQSKVAQFIKQVFCKTSKYSVKIATIWNKDLLQGHLNEGLELGQDIFRGPDLDVILTDGSVDPIKYFKEALINTYYMYMAPEENDEAKLALADYIEKEIFGESVFRHIICGSQGVSRSFMSLAKEYLSNFDKMKVGMLKNQVVYDIIINQYLEDVSSKIPDFTLSNTIDEFISKNACRFFLISLSDYKRCKSLIMYLFVKGFFVVLPKNKTEKKLRKYKLCIIHYGHFLEVLKSNKSSRRKLEEDSKFGTNGILIPDINDDITQFPEKYTIKIPNGAENEVYCPTCNAIFTSEEKSKTITCPYCEHETMKFSEFITEVSL